MIKTKWVNSEVANESRGDRASLRAWDERERVGAGREGGTRTFVRRRGEVGDSFGRASGMRDGREESVGEGSGKIRGGRVSAARRQQRHESGGKGEGYGMM